MLYQIFRDTQDKFKVKSRELAKALNYSEKHISQFRNGKASIPLDKFWELMDVMEEKSPGSYSYFLQEWAKVKGLALSDAIKIEAAVPQILCVDDDEASLNILKIILSKLNYRCEAVTSADRALEFLETSDSVRLVITDLKMPVKDGIKLATELERRYRDRVEVLMVSAFLGRDVIQEALLSCRIFAGFVDKPVRKEQLADLIPRVFDRPPVAAA